LMLQNRFKSHTTKRHRSSRRRSCSAPHHRSHHYVRKDRFNVYQHIFVSHFNNVKRAINHLGRVKAMFMPNGEGEQFIYNQHGYETEQRNATSAAVYRQVVSTNARGQITRELKGFNLATDTVYWDDGQVKQITHTKNGVAIRQLNYAYDVFGNVATQALNNGLAGNTVESFAYDKLHRLTQSTRTGAASATVSYGYDAAGNFNFKSDFSTATGTPYNLATGGLGGGGANAVKSVALAAGGTRSYGYDASGNMTSDNAGFSAIYDHANLATKLTRGAVTNYFTYGPSNAKAKQTGSDGTKAYVGSYEDWVTAAQTKVSLGNYAQVTNGTGGRQLHYFLTDRLGSVDAVTDSVGTLIETRGFDAFGAPRTGTWGDAQQIASTAITPKGFTSHEHLNSLKLIHMNGRIYDYQLGRFMGVDPFIQFPTNSQSLNPYSYVLNNPLAGTDPTGYAISCMMNDICNLQNELYGQNGARNDIYKKFGLGGNGDKKQTEKSMVSTVKEGVKSFVSDAKALFNGEAAEKINVEMRSGKKSGLALALEDGIIGGSNANNETEAHRDLGRNLQTTKVVAEVSGKVVVAQAKDPLTYVGPAIAVVGALKAAVLIVKIGKAEEAVVDTTRVGRWMSKAEHEKMLASGKVQESFTGTTHVTNPANPATFMRQAKPGSNYVEFDVPTSSVKATSENGVSKILGPRTTESRLAIKNGKPALQMPSCSNIQVCGSK
jgi:RHS repeat-associated protein